MTERLVDTFSSEVGEAEIAVLMPIHNEAETIENSVIEFYDVVSPRMPLELVLSEDGSTDDTENVIEKLSEKKPASIKTCALIDKLERREEEIIIDYQGFRVEKGFLIGYGLDYDEKYRHLPDIYTLK